MSKILIAEDERDIRDLITFTLRFGGYDVVAASNGEEAVTLAKQELPDLILMDVRMPRMTGYEACTAIKADPRLKDIPVIFLSAKGQESEIQAGLQAGATEYLLKPFAPDQLINRIRSVLSKPAGAAPASSLPGAKLPGTPPAGSTPPTGIPPETRSPVGTPAGSTIPPSVPPETRPPEKPLPSQNPPAPAPSENNRPWSIPFRRILSGGNPPANPPGEVKPPPSEPLRKLPSEKGPSEDAPDDRNPFENDVSGGDKPSV